MSRRKPRKLSRAEQSRVNGAKSHGPISPEGKARSSENATTHGLTSRRVVLKNESLVTYHIILARYLELLQPTDALEHELVQTLVDARWRIRRAQSLETAAYEMSMLLSAGDLAKKFNNADASMQQVFCFGHNPNLNAQIAAFHQHENRFHLIFERTYKLLARHRGNKLSALPSREDLSDLETDLPDNFAAPPIASQPPQKQSPALQTEPQLKKEPAPPAATPRHHAVSSPKSRQPTATTTQSALNRR